MENKSYYVKAGGNDMNNGLTEQSPFQTLAKAVKAAQDGAIKNITVIGVLDSESESRADAQFPKDPDDESVFYIRDSGKEEILITGKDKAKLIGTQGDRPPGAHKLADEKTAKRVLRITGVSNIRLENITIAGGKAGNVFALLFPLNNPPRGYGGGIYISRGSKVTLGRGVKLQNNYAAGHGGGAAVAGGSLILSGAAIENCEGNNGGGGIYISDAYFPVVNGEILDDPRSYGKDDHVRISSVFMMTDGKIENNHSSKGGGIAIDGTHYHENEDIGVEAAISGGLIANNNAGYGGGVYVQGLLEMTDGIICNNKAGKKNIKPMFVPVTIPFGTASGVKRIMQGGGVYVSGTFKMSGGSIRENESSLGGGVCIESRSTCIVSKGIIKNNRAYKGNEIWVSSTGMYENKNENGFFARRGIFQEKNEWGEP